MENPLSSAPSSETSPTTNSSDLQGHVHYAVGQVVQHHSEDVDRLFRQMMDVLENRLDPEEKQLFRSIYWQLASMVMNYTDPRLSLDMGKLLFVDLPQYFSPPPQDGPLEANSFLAQE